jgi:hypothetical protein
MNVTKLLLATLVGGLVNFMVGWGVYGMALANAFKLPADVEALIAKPEAEMGLVTMFLSCLVWSGLLSYIFLRWAGIRSFVSGASAAVIIGVLVSLTINLGMLAMYKTNFMDTTKLMVDAAANAVCSAITGGAIGWMLGRGEKA